MPSTLLKKIIFILSAILFLAGVGMILYAVFLGPEADTGGYYFEFGGVVLAFVPAVLGLAGLSLTYWNDKEVLGRISRADLRARNRKDLLDVADRRVIEELTNGVHELVFLKLGIVQQEGQTSGRPWRLQELPSGELLPADMRLSQIYEQSGRSLLILGEPASGKSTTMYQLAEELITAAKIDSNLPIPLIFNLSSWALKRGPLIEWLVESAYFQYGASRKGMRSWLEQGDNIALFLDGLDEVDPQYRNDCVDAINEYYHYHEGELVVCSRTEDYDQLSQKLELNHAIEIQPLTIDEVDRYLDRFNILEAIRVKVAHEAEWQELVQSPLMLTLIPWTFGDGNFDLVQADNMVDQLLSLYVDKAFSRRDETKKKWGYSKKDALKWLHNLASWMDQEKQSEFYIEQIQPKLILGEGNRYSWISKLSLGLIGGLSGWLIFGLNIWLNSRLFFGLIDGLLFGLLYGLFCGLIFGLFSGLLGRYFKSVSFGKINTDVYIELVEKQGFNLKLGLSVGLIFGLSVGLIFGLSGMLIFGLSGALIFGLSGALIFGLSGALIFGLSDQASTIINSDRLSVNQGVIASFKNTITFGLLSGLLSGLIFELFFRLALKQSFGLSGGLIIGLIAGLISGLVGFMEHVALRWELNRLNILPGRFRFKPEKNDRLALFLDDMVDIVLLKRVGGGWRFIHRYLLEHLAEDPPEHDHAQN